ncbi:MAG: hypothetical protein CMG14_00060 [Candidatus Marinimicrobia bacterium]|nr:hypothetical protein [Candidatus Neomarinimicrobiota bacterium]
MTLYRIIYSLIGIVISICLIYYISHKYTVLDGLFSRGDIKTKDIIFFISLYSLALFLKPLRYLFIISPEKLRAFVKGFYIGNFLNLLIPFRIGDISRIFMFTDIISKSENLRLILAEKILDLFLMFLFLGLFYFFSERFNLVMNYFQFTLILLLILVALVIYFNLQRLASVLIISSFAWFIEGIAFSYFLLVVLDLRFLDGFSFLPIATISTLIPSAPGYLGVINWAMIIWAEFLEVSNSSIGTITFEIYILMWLSTFLFGLLSILSVKNELMHFLESFFRRKIK